MPQRLIYSTDLSESAERVTRAAEEGPLQLVVIVDHTVRHVERVAEVLQYDTIGPHRERLAVIELPNSAHVVGVPVASLMVVPKWRLW